jgi:serine/threonine protein kinase
VEENNPTNDRPQVTHANQVLKMSEGPDVIIYAWLPRGVQNIIATGGSHYIGLIDAGTVLKYPQIPPKKLQSNVIGDEKILTALRKQAVLGLQVEESIFRALGRHDRIVGFKGTHEDGILLEYMPTGSLARLLHSGNFRPTIEQKLTWALQAAEAVAYIHAKGVLHCNIGVGNLLLDNALNVKLCDFQGQMLGLEGQVLLDGGSCEDAYSYMPGSDSAPVSTCTDIFALGSTIFCIMTGSPPFGELDAFREEEEIRARFEAGLFPPLSEELGGEVVRGCWTGRYAAADDVVRLLRDLRLGVTGQKL